MKKSHHSNVRNSVRGGIFMLGMVTIIQGRLQVNRVAFVKLWSINSPHFLLYIPPTYFLISSYQLIAGVYSNLILFQPISSLPFPVLFYSILFCSLLLHSNAFDSFPFSCVVVCSVLRIPYSLLFYRFLSMTSLLLCSLIIQPDMIFLSYRKQYINKQTKICILSFLWLRFTGHLHLISFHIVSSQPITSIPFQTTSFPPCIFSFPILLLFQILAELLFL